MKSKKISSQPKSDQDIFDNLSGEWWDENGGFAALHTFNPLRISYILNVLGKPIKNLKVLDIGCGGGILCEPLSRLEAKVTGIDENKKAIFVAKGHAKISNLNINYINGDITKKVPNEKFDLITCMEVVEHVENLELLLQKVRKLMNKGGVFVGSTINKTITSYISAIFLAEKILKIVPENTHSWNKFVKPNMLKKELLNKNFSQIKFQGVFYNPLMKNWKYINNKLINYMFSCKVL